MPTLRPSAMRIALALLGAARGRALTTPLLLGAADLLGLSPNAMRVAISRLAARGDVTPKGRGAWALSARHRESFEHVRRYRTGFATRVPWRGGYLGVLTAELPRRNATLVRRRARSLDLGGFRPLRHGLFVRPDNLAGGRAAVTAHLARLGLDAAAVWLGVTLDADQAAEVERRYRVSADAQQAERLARRVEALLPRLSRHPPREAAARSFWLGDEVLRFLGRDPLLPAQLADPAPRRRLAVAMDALDRRGQAVWRSLLEAQAP